MKANKAIKANRLKPKQKGRDSLLDIIRIVAVATVLSVHFFLHNGFYSQTVQGKPMYIMVLMRTFFSVCVPMFMVLTGYLMCRKTLSKKYYKGIVNTLIIYVLSALACMIFKAVHDGAEFTFKSVILGIFDFTGANYSWYIEMYIGLFLIAPFLNLAYNKLTNKRHKQVLVFTFVFLTIIPSVFNIFNFGSLNWWADPTTSDEFQKLIPNWWIGFYPVAYYFTGCYLREYGLKFRTRTLFALLIASTVIFGTFNFYRSYGTTFKSGSYLYWYGIEPYVLTILLFSLLKRIKTDNMKKATKTFLWKLSDLALGIYLLSFIFDSMVYPILCQKVPVMTDRLPYYFVTVPIVFVCSAMSSAVLKLLTNWIILAYNKISEFVKEQRLKKDKYKWQDCLFIVLLLGGILFAFWKCKYGFGGSDEAFYLTIPHRLIHGDALFTDEWHLSQLSGLLLVPFVWIYETITQSTEGIILAARFTYVVFHAIISIVIYTRFRKFGYISVFASVLFFIYTPYNIMAMNYDSMGVDFIAVTGAIMGTTNYKKKLPLIISGLTFAASVLCCPYLMIAYVLYAICVLVHIIIKKRDSKFILKSELFSLKTFLFFTLGAAILALIFVIFVLSKASFGDILRNFPYLMTDPEHPSIPLFKKFTTYFDTTVNSIALFKVCVYSYLAMFVIMLIDRKRSLHRAPYLIITASIVIFSYVLIVPNMVSSTYNAIMYPLIFIGITSYTLCKNKPKELFAALFISGIIYSFCIHCTSNQYFYVISMAMASTNLASYIFLAQLIKEMQETPDNITYALWIKRAAFVTAGFMIFLQGALQISIKANHCFWEFGDPSTLVSKINDGPAKGIYTNLTNRDNCEKIYNDINSYYSNKEPDKILFLSNKTWAYLAVKDYPFGTLSAWMSENVPSFNRLLTYYEVNPENTPKYVYIPKDSEWDLTKVQGKAAEYGYQVNEDSVSYKLEKIN